MMNRAQNNRFKLQEGRVRLNIKKELLCGKNGEAQEEISWTYCTVFPNDVFKQK